MSWADDNESEINEAFAEEANKMSEQTKPSTSFYVGSHWVTVDSEMIPILSKFTWNAKPSKGTYYLQTNLRVGGITTTVSMHRFLTGFPSGQIDHINRNGLDNRLANLRHATNQQNSCNRIRKNTHGFRGVYKQKHSPRYAVQIQINGKKIYKHGFETAEEAAREYDKLSKEYHGEFGIRNFKD